ncbi:Calcineurin-like phosphoesterase [Sulfobacillus thermosulfidooxidans DSM 9293]|uniref:Calcineurin-like phosphoesterase n=1 Tax=Sulfobacillus thermosulfidooxidans (strain DSM 9293 / VKM B-1269 / AT-1) TaxID=929705 RepID=A0A1W1WDA6_SULTA|nr:metallophosphoesterase [Sulfobacillus thermosulfidooxidans]SMC04149.1 Calcineurin-like phosphoesterase [Sulfobacillus thermosulfidooxidans DSM 9293]
MANPEQPSLTSGVSPGKHLQDSLTSRRQFLRQFLGASFMAAGGIWMRDKVFASSTGPSQPLRFVQLSDTHIGYQGDANRDVLGSLAIALGAIALLDPKPDFIVVTGDLTQGTSQESERLKRFQTFRHHLLSLHIPVYTVAGEHDALMDQGQSYEKAMGPLYYDFRLHGVQFYALDNVSRGFFVGEKQRQWLKQRLKQANPMAPTVIFCHAPLYDVFSPWNWYTYDAHEVLKLFAPFHHLSVFFGHVHQLLSHQGSFITQYGAMPTSWPLPEPGFLTVLERWPQSTSDPYMGLGFRVVDIKNAGLVQIQNVLLQDAVNLRRRSSS